MLVVAIYFTQRYPTRRAITWVLSKYYAEYYLGSGYGTLINIFNNIRNQKPILIITIMATNDNLTEDLNGDLNDSEMTDSEVEITNQAEHFIDVKNIEVIENNIDGYSIILDKDYKMPVSNKAPTKKQIEEASKSIISEFEKLKPIVKKLIEKNFNLMEENKSQQQRLQKEAQRHTRPQRPK
jgi:hypothetical protein